MSGVLALRLKPEQAMGAEERELLAEVAGDLGHGLQRIESEERLRVRDRAIHASINAIALADTEGRITSANPAALRMWGYEDESAVEGEKASAFWESQERAQDAFRAAKEKGAWEGEMVASRKDGSTFIAQASLSLVQDSDGNPTHTLGVFLDITDRKEAEKQLERHRRQEVRMERLSALGQMASGIAHDINNAIGPVLGYADFLLEKEGALDDEETVRRRLRMIKKSAQGAKEVVGRLRQFYSDRDDRRGFAAVDLNAVVEQAISLTKPKWKEEPRAAGIEISVNTDLDDIPIIAGQEAELREMLTNLIFNSVDAMPRGGTLTITTRSEGDPPQTVLQVSDTGEGMTAEVWQNCLEPFYTTKGASGSGLGLATVYGTVNRHGGELDIDSAPGQGTTITVRLPTAHEKIAGTREEGASDTVRIPPLNVLVVEDEPGMRAVFSDMLAADHHAIEMAANGREGLETFRAGDFDLVITDQAMPEMSGEQMAGAIKREGSEVPVLMITGFSGEVEEKDERIKNIDWLLHKPITIQDLRRAITRVMSESDTS